MAKEHPIDVEVREYRRLQDGIANQPKNRITQTVLLSVAVLLLLAFGLGIYLLPYKTVSEEENRTLQTFPSFSVEGFLSGKYTADVATFYADQFPLRNAFVGLKALSETALLKQENNGVLIGDDGYLIDRLEYGNAEYEYLNTNLLAIQNFSALAEAEGKHCTVAVAPRTVDVMEPAYPLLYTNDRASVIRSLIRDKYPNAVDLAFPLSERAAEGEYVMFRTDHHWTPLGAYYAYTALGETLGYDPLPRDAFTETTVTEEFFGTTYSSSGIKWAESDTITLFCGADDDLYTVTVHESGKTMQGFYDESFLETKDKYGVFLGGNFGHVSIKKSDGTDRPVLLLVKDSFALSAVPFLARHYDIEMIDLRYFSGTASDFFTGESDTLPECDEALILMGVDSLTQSNILRKLLYGTS